MNNKNMHYDPNNSEVIPLYKFQNIKESQIQKKEKKGKNYNSICFGLITITIIMIFCSLLIFTILLPLELDENINLNSYIIMMPLFISILLGFILGNKIIAHPIHNYLKLAKFFLYFTLNSTLFLILLFSILIALKFEGILPINYATVFIPIFVVFFLIFVFISFILPGLLDKEIGMQKEAFLIICYFLIGLTTSIILCLRLDEITNWKYFNIFIGLFIIGSVHLFQNIIDLFKNKDKITFLNELILIFLFFGLVLILLKVDGILNINWKIIFITIYLLLVLIFAKSIKLLIKTLQKDSEI